MYDRVLLPTDGSEGAAVATDHAFDLAERYDVPLFVLYVVDLTVSQGADAYSSEAISALKAAGERQLEAVVERARQEGLEVTSAVLEGKPARTIVDATEPGDVIVIGSHGRTGLERYLIGSTTEKVVRTAEVPVLTVPAKGVADRASR